MCCGRKKQKPADTKPKSVNEYTLAEPNLQVTNPKSKIIFKADDYDPRPMEIQQSFVATKKATRFVEDRSDRLEDYGQQSRVAAQSKLIAPLSLLSYDLDGEEGISGNPTVDTFHYEAALSHWFLHTDKTDYPQRDSNKYKVVYEPSSSDYVHGLNAQ